MIKGAENMICLEYNQLTNLLAFFTMVIWISITIGYVAGIIYSKKYNEIMKGVDLLYARRNRQTKKGKATKD